MQNVARIVLFLKLNWNNFLKNNALIANKKGLLKKIAFNEDQERTFVHYKLQKCVYFLRWKGFVCWEHLFNMDQGIMLSLLAD